MNIKKTLFLGLLCLAQTAWSDLFIQGKNNIQFIKSSSTIENLDTANFAGGGYSSGWTENRNLTIDFLSSKLIYVHKPTSIYATASGRYGWILDGNTRSYPLRWDTEGHAWGFTFEAGYIMDVCEAFKFIPHAGFDYGQIHSRYKHQKEIQANPTCFANQNNKKFDTTLYFPYIGVEFDFVSRFCGCYDIQFSTIYELGFVNGHGRDRVANFFVTDVPGTSFYGSRTKYRDLISHEFEVAATYQLNNKWQVGLGLDYNFVYNTKNLKNKLQNNDQIVDAGQFTASQYHRVTDYTAHTYAIVFSLVYNLSGEGGTALVK